MTVIVCDERMPAGLKVAVYIRLSSGNKTGYRKIGTPKLKWRDVIQKDTKDHHLCTGNIICYTYKICVKLHFHSFVREEQIYADAD